MPRWQWFRTTTVTMFVLSTVVAGSAVPAQATPATAVAKGTAATTPAGRFGTGRPVAVTKATIEEIRAIAEKGNGTLLTLRPDTRNGGASIAATITCTLVISPPFGGGSPGASVQVDAALQCTDWMDFVSLYVELWRDLGQVANSGAAAPIIPALYVSARESTCRNGIYWGVATAFMRRSGYVPPSGFIHVHSLQPLPVGCGSAPPPPPPPPAGAVFVNNPGNRLDWAGASRDLQMTATGGTGSYTWSATGLPPGLYINPSTGLISGLATTIGTYTVTVHAASGIGSTGFTTFTWTIGREPCPRC